MRRKDGSPHTYLIVIQVVQTPKGKFFSIFFTTLREFPELAQRAHGLPPVQEGNGPSWSQLLPWCPHHTSGCALRLSQQALSLEDPNPGPASSSAGTYMRLSIILQRFRVYL